MISKASPNWSLYEKAHRALRRHSRYAAGIVLDIGCGKKPFLDVFEGCVDRYIGLDIPSKIDRPDANERAARTDLYGDGLSLPLKDASVDTVLAFFVIEHIFPYDGLFREAHRVLKRGGPSDGHLPLDERASRRALRLFPVYRSCPEAHGPEA